MKASIVALFKSIIIILILIVSLTSCNDLRDEGYLKNTWMQEKVYLGNKVEVFLTFNGSGTWSASGQINDSVSKRFYDGYFTTDDNKLYVYDSEADWDNQNASGEYNLSIYEDWIDLRYVTDSDSTRGQFLPGTWLATY